LKIAAILSLLLGVAGLVAAIPLLMQGRTNVEQTLDGPPYALVVAIFGFAIVRIVGAYGTWKRQRWGIVLTLLANTIDSVLAAPGFFFAPTTQWQMIAFVSVLIGVVIIVFCLWRDPRPATS
jgi:uncharacterized membrane protein (DUF2068 family)